VVLYSAAPFFSQRPGAMCACVAWAWTCRWRSAWAAAFAASLWATLTGRAEVYFDSVTMFVFFLLCGRYLEMLARQKACAGSRSWARPCRPSPSDWLPGPLPEGERVPVSQLVAGDMVRIKPGETVPADGVVIDGDSEANEALLTGESRPVPKAPGAR
jgi:Cu2+-exporting ATPase